MARILVDWQILFYRKENLVSSPRSEYRYNFFDPYLDYCVNTRKKFTISCLEHFHLLQKVSAPKIDQKFLSIFGAGIKNEVFW